MKTDIQIARECKLDHISEIASRLGIPTEEIEPYGRYMAKVPISLIDEKKVNQSRLILVTAISPTKAESADPGNCDQPDKSRYR